MDRCVFCNREGEFSPEHWIPQWLSHELRKRGYVPEGDEDLFNMTVPHVCGECNSGWMSNIETRAKRHVLPLILGDYSQPLTAQAVEHTVRWGYLKVISLELGRPAEHVPTHKDETYAQFKETRYPPYPNCSLAIGAREPITERHPTYVTFTSQALNQPGTVDTPRGPLTYKLHWHQTTLFVGHLVLNLVGFPNGERANVHHAPGLQSVWPLLRDGGTFSWPPKERLRLDQFGL